MTFRDEIGTEADAVTLTLKQVDAIVPPLSMLARTTALRSQAPAAFGWKPAHPNPLAHTRRRQLAHVPTSR